MILILVFCVFPATTPDLVSTNYTFNKDYRLTLNGVLRYNTKIGSDHEIGALAGYEQWYFDYYDFSASKLGLIDYTITQLTPAGKYCNYCDRTGV